MKKLMVVATVAAFVLSAGMAMAVGSQTVAVSATVVGVCQFLTGGTIDFTLDPSVGGAVAGTVSQPTFWCTNGTSYTITDDSGLNELAAGSPRMKHQTGTVTYIPYSLSYTSTGTGSGKNSTISMDIASQVLQADYVDALAGSYADTVTLTINP